LIIPEDSIPHKIKIKGFSFDLLQNEENVDLGLSTKEDRLWIRMVPEAVPYQLKLMKAKLIAS
jgi:hypothetical protein